MASTGLHRSAPHPGLRREELSEEHGPADGLDRALRQHPLGAGHGAARSLLRPRRSVGFPRRRHGHLPTPHALARGDVSHHVGRRLGVSVSRGAGPHSRRPRHVRCLQTHLGFGHAERRAVLYLHAVRGLCPAALQLSGGRGEGPDPRGQPGPDPRPQREIGAAPVLIGSSPLRKEDRRLLVGAGRYLDDLRRDGMVHLGVVRSTEAHARIAKVATSEAFGTPGLISVWTAGDLPEIARPLVTAGAERRRPYTMPVLATDVARYVGEPIAIVLADTAAQLADALAVVRVDYDPLEPITSAEDGLATAARPHGGWPDNAAIVAKGAVGDPQAALAGADVVIREKIRHARLAAAPIEPRGVLAYSAPD